MIHTHSLTRLITLYLLMHLPANTFAMPLEKLLGSLDETRQQSNVPALGLTLIKDDKLVWCGAQGVADITSKQPATFDTVFRIGSITKSFTAMALLILQERGKIDLNDPVSKYLPDSPYTNPWKKTQPITIAHLLEQTSGLQDMTSAEFSHSDPTPVSLKQGLNEFADTHISRWPPGRQFSYSNVNAGIAGRVMEVVSGQTYESFIENEIFKPLNMQSASVLLDNKTRLKLATGYDSDGRTPIPYWHMVMRPFGAINASLEDMTRYLRMLINRGVAENKPVISAESITRMETPETTLAAQAGMDFGYGLGIYSYMHNGIVMYGHGGDGDGYLARLGYIPEQRSGYFLVINAFKNNALVKLQTQVEDYLTQDIKARIPRPAATNSDELKKLSGHYSRLTRRFPEQPVHEDSDAIKIEYGKNYLILNKSGSRKRLYPVKDLLFRRARDSVATFAFIPGSDGAYVLQGPPGNFQQQHTTD